ncbi:dipeptide epimerase [Psychrobacillus psychrodurans]|uniref:mandelate racemase/muconate lactonizing enzyme family protein n=1 Tax=Psychrobacillus TaxID=1221880 RepID=UPI0008E07B46|nr:dipeptide epimerase [Psychrobacillus psychrodurans]MCK1997776.1 dipeptide epimerase [Psychrobacillus psychrodurans]MCZ8540959.1 dipeptide epimerase [Psychrobacillus psychrodurans]SFM81543.1 o-succinylbenzoate synthase [Psychrobacillus psychrodurans]
MYIKSIETFDVAIPLTKPFKTALRTVTTAYSVYVTIVTSDGLVGYGEAPPTHVITGESMDSIRYAINEVIAPQLIGLNILQSEQVFQKLNTALVRNTSAKAAVDMAIHDILARYAGLPLYQFLGGYRDTIETDFTVSVNDPAEMADDAEQYIKDGFKVLKVKVGIGDIKDDIERIHAIRKRVGMTPKLRLDANQGWNAKEAVKAISLMEDAGLSIEFVEQPVPAWDLEGLKYVTDHTYTPIMADESVFSVQDAKQVLKIRAADLINIKLMKSGGIYHGKKINALAEANGVGCMVGSMIETKLGITAAAHFAASQPNIRYFDFDAPLMLDNDLIVGGVIYEKSKMSFSNELGLGITHVNLD